MNKEKENTIENFDEREVNMQVVKQRTISLNNTEINERSLVEHE